MLGYDKYVRKFRGNHTTYSNKTNHCLLAIMQHSQNKHLVLLLPENIPLVSAPYALRKKGFAQLHQIYALLYGSYTLLRRRLLLTAKVLAP